MIKYKEYSKCYCAAAGRTQGGWKIRKIAYGLRCWEGGKKCLHLSQKLLELLEYISKWSSKLYFQEEGQ